MSSQAFSLLTRRVRSTSGALKLLDGRLSCAMHQPNKLLDFREEIHIRHRFHWSTWAAASVIIYDAWVIEYF